MARIFGVDLPKNKRVEIGLCSIYGVGRKLSRSVLKKCKIDYDKKTSDLSINEINIIRAALEKYQVEGELRKSVRLSIKRLVEIGCYRGIRHRKKLPVRGQRTQSNARTRKGPRKTVANKKKATK